MAKLHAHLNRRTDKVIGRLTESTVKLVNLIVKDLEHILGIYLVSTTYLIRVVWLVPVVIVATHIMGALTRRLTGQRDRGNDKANQDTLEIFQKIKTVRQFSMEEEEVANYTAANARESIVSERLDFVNDLARFFEWKTFAFSEAYGFYIAYIMVKDGELHAMDAVVVAMLNKELARWVKNTAKTINGEILDMSRHLHALSALLDMEPRIESTETSTLLKVRETASELVIRDSFGYRLQYQD